VRDLPYLEEHGSAPRRGWALAPQDEAPYRGSRGRRHREARTSAWRSRRVPRS